MKYILSLLLAVSVGFGVLPVTTFAIESDEPKFEEFLNDIGWDEQDYIAYLESKDWNLEDYESVNELGTPLTEKSIASVLEEFDLNREKLNSLLIENGDIENGQDVLEGTVIIFEEELYENVDFYLNGWEGTPTDFYVNGAEHFADLFAELDLTDEEFEELFTHIETLEFENPAFEKRLLELSDRMIAFEEFEIAEELSADQIAEIFDIYSDMLNLFQMESKNYLVEDGEKLAVSTETLMYLDKPKGFNVLIEIYNEQGEFLADLLLTGDMVESDLIHETGKDLIEAEEILTTTSEATKPPVQTVKGGKLPTTASDYVRHIISWTCICFSGCLYYSVVLELEGTNHEWLQRQKQTYQAFASYFTVCLLDYIWTMV